MKLVGQRNDPRRRFQSVDATTYIYASEIFPTPIRARGIGISITGLFVATIIFLQVAPTAFAAITGYYYLVGAGVTIFFAILAYFYFPEVSLPTCLSTFGAVRRLIHCADQESVVGRHRRGLWRQHYLGRSGGRGHSSTLQRRTLSRNCHRPSRRGN